jgi:hypothetical protein
MATLRLKLVLALALIAPLSLTACGTSSETHASPSSATPAVPPVAGRAWQQAPLDSVWKQVLAQGVVALSRRVSLVPLALAGDGRTFFASMYSKKFSGVVRVDALSKRFTPIRPFPDVETDQALGSSDGRSLVWAEYHTPTYDDATIWAWDSTSGRVRQIGAARRAPSGDWGGAAAPEVRDGLATWTQPSAPDSGEVHVFDLASGHDRIVYRGRVGESFLLPGRLVAWSTQTTADGAARLMAADAVTGRRAALPPAIAGLRGASAAGLATDGTALAYSDADASWGSLWWSPSLATAAQRVFTAAHGQPIDNSLQAAGRYVCFGVAPRTYLADVTTGRYIQISPGGWALLDAKALVLLKPSKTKADHAIADVVFLPLSSLPAIP